MITNQPMRPPMAYPSGNVTLLSAAYPRHRFRKQGMGGLAGLGDALTDFTNSLQADENTVIGDGNVVYTWDANATAPDGTEGDFTADPNLTQVLQQMTQTAGAAATKTAINTASTASAAGGGSFIDSLIKALPAVMQANAQSQLISTNLARAKQGLPPIPLSSVTPGINFGLTPGTQGSVMTLGIIALGVFGLVSLMKNR